MRLVRAAGDAGELALAPLAPLWPGVSQARVLDETPHRPWPLPEGRWVMAQSWEDLLFAHWRLDPAALRPLIPEALELDTFDGAAWLGITPFEVSGLRLRGTPPPPWLSRFPELNVRTYVSFAGKPGIWFFSLDAGNPAAVAGARRTYKLPYFHADMTIARTAEGIDYRSRRTGAELHVSYASIGDAQPAAAGTLDHWLTERYCLYALDEHARVRRAEIHHPPWPLQPAEATFAVNTMAPVELPDEPPLLHFSRRQDVLIWPLTFGK